jgi:hypothetical protein
MKTRQLLSILLVVSLSLTTGCGLLIHHPDPLAGWSREIGHEPDPMITKDYQDYIEHLPPEDRRSRGPVEVFADQTGRHAIRFETGAKRTSHAHVLIYDENNNRTSVKKYIRGYFLS